MPQGLRNHRASRGGLGTKIHAVVDACGRPIAFALTEGQAHQVTVAEMLLEDASNTTVLGDRGHDAASLVNALCKRHCKVVIPP